MQIRNFFSSVSKRTKTKKVSTINHSYMRILTLRAHNFIVYIFFFFFEAEFYCIYLVIYRLSQIYLKLLRPMEKYLGSHAGASNLLQEKNTYLE